MDETIEHPGIIVFVDADAGTERPTDAALVPRTIAFAQTDKGEVPVVRVVARRRGGALEIQSFGADGAFLAVTMQALPPGA
jgi:hypothetical protein